MLCSKLLGKSSDVAAFEDEDSSFDPESLEVLSHVSEEWEPAEAVLLADRSGTSIKFPICRTRFNRKLAAGHSHLHWWRFRLPAFALADDGVLIEHRGKGSLDLDWIPPRHVPHIVNGEQGLASGIPFGCRRICSHPPSHQDELVRRQACTGRQI